MQIEIDAVASTIKGAKLKQPSGNKPHEHKGKDQPDHHGGGHLQQALAADRLTSLRKAKAQIQKEILQSHPSPSASNRKDKMLAMLVQDEPRHKKPPVGPKNIVKRPMKTVTYDDDNNFDAVLDGASAGFMETVSLSGPCFLSYPLCLTLF